MYDFRLVSYLQDYGAPSTGILINDKVFDLPEVYRAADSNIAFDPSVMMSVLNAWCNAKGAIEEAIGKLHLNKNDHALSGIGLNEITLTAPVKYPGVLYCAGVNYRDHVIEMTGKPPAESNTDPFFFLKTTRGTIIGPNDTIQLPNFSLKVDWEAEIALVIGRQARNVSKHESLQYVAGLSILNDVSARDLMTRDDVPFGFDWLGQKCFDTAAPMGPWITPLDFINDPNNMSIKLWVNDELMQDSNSKELIFKFDDLVSYLSKHVTLYPGDIIATGTPAGCGHPDGRYLKDGDEVRIAIDGLGELRNSVVQL